ncbi:uncharacterized protein WM277_016914 [Molossus nigricans]
MPNFGPRGLTISSPASPFGTRRKPGPLTGHRSAVSSAASRRSSPVATGGRGCGPPLSPPPPRLSPAPSPSAGAGGRGSLGVEAPLPPPRCGSSCSSLSCWHHHLLTPPSTIIRIRKLEMTPPKPFCPY